MGFMVFLQTERGIFHWSLDCDEDPGERLYHYHTLRRITPANLLEHKEAAICSMLPDWYFNPYSQEYKEYFEVGMEQNG